MRRRASSHGTVPVLFGEMYDLSIEFEYDRAGGEWFSDVQALDYYSGTELTAPGFSATGVGATAMDAAVDAFGEMGADDGDFIFNDEFMQEVRGLADAAHMEQL